MAVLLLHRSSGMIKLEASSVSEYARDHGFDVAPAILDGDLRPFSTVIECVKLLRGGDWVATAQSVSLSVGTSVVPQWI